MAAAEKAGIGRDTLSDIEHGKRRPTMPTIKALADAYGVPIEELLDEGRAVDPRPLRASAIQKLADVYGVDLESLLIRELEGRRPPLVA